MRRADLNLRCLGGLGDSASGSVQIVRDNGNFGANAIYTPDALYENSAKEPIVPGLDCDGGVSKGFLIVLGA
jgi:hypothetical protein